MHQQKYYNSKVNMNNTKATEERIRAQDEEINYLKSKLYELAKTNKKLEKELDYANHKIRSLESVKKHIKNNYKENQVSKPRGQTSKPRNTPTRNTTQTSTNKNDMYKSKKSHLMRHTYTQRNPYTETRRDKQLKTNNH